MSKNISYNAAIYLRLSKEDGDVTDGGKAVSNSIANQEELVRDYLKSQADIRVYSVYKDDGYSGVNFDRPMFQKMLEDIKSGAVNCVIVKNLSRFGRNYIESGRYIEKIFPMLGVRFIAVNDYYDSLSEDTGADMIIPFKNLINDALITAAYAGKDDAYAKTAERVLLTPLSTKAIVWAKVLSCGLVFFLCGIFVYGAVGFLVGLETRSIGWVSILYFALSFAVSSLGTLIGLGMKNFLVLKNVLNIPIAVFAILGGTFFRIGTFSRVGNFVLNLSPIRWINRSLFQLLFEGDQMLLLYATGVLIIVGSVCAVLAIKTFQKGEYMNGSMPGYEK